jgi:DNA-binding MarR family transcriptional regulator
MKEYYFRFLALAQTLSAPMENTDSVDLLSQRLLEVIALRQNQGEPMTVTDAMSLRKIASPATLHRKLDQLLEARLIEQTFSDGNRRTKYLVPTKVADQYFSNLSKAIVDAST